MTVPEDRTPAATEDRQRPGIEVAQLGTVLGVWAHPDDEAYLSAGIMGALLDAGHRVVVATATYGESGMSDPVVPPDELAAIRREELDASLALVGVREHHWLGYADGACADARDAEEMVVRLVREVEPDTILTFGPDGMTGHPDHRAVSAWTTAAWLASGSRARLLYATLTPAFHAEWGEVNDRVGLWMSDGRGPVTAHEELAVYVALAGADLDRKIDAVRAHLSQTTGLVEEVGPENFRRWWSTEAFVAASPALASGVSSVVAASGGAR